MPRIAVLAFVAVIGILIALALMPGEEGEAPDSRIRLTEADVALYPSSDADATWSFEAPEVYYDPDAGETTLLRVQDGERRVDGEVDFTLRSERLVIDRNDDLRSPEMFVHLIEDDLDVTMVGREQRQVFVDQRSGRFEVPHITLVGEDFGESVYEDMRVSFDFTDFEAGGPGTVGHSEFLIEERTESTP